MNDLDLPTLTLTSAVSIMVVTVLFATTTVTRHPDRASRWWTAGFVAASTLAIIAVVWGRDESTPLAVAATSSVGATFAIGAIWIGVCASFESSSRALALTAAASAASAAGWGVVALGADRRIATCVAAAAMAVLAAGGAAALGRAPTRSSINSKILRVSLVLTAVAAAVRTVSFAASGHGATSDVAIVAWFALLITICAITLSVLRVERLGTWWAISDDPDEQAHRGLAPEAGFRRQLADRLERSALVGDTPAVVQVTIEDLTEINEAYGRTAGDQAIGYVTQVMRTRLPSSALLGHLGANRLAASLTVSAQRTTEVVESALGTALLDAPLPPGLPMRLRCTIRSVTSSADHDVDELLQELRQS